MLHKFFGSRGLLNAEDPVGKLCVTFDNCSGQNKNRMVLRYFAWLVESGYALEAFPVFLVRGHTKNACDRMFNILKNEYRKKNIYCEEALMKSLNFCSQVTAHKMLPEEFRDWDESFDLIHKRPAGYTERPHCFRFCKLYPGICLYKDHDGEPEKEGPLFGRGTPQGDARKEILSNSFPPPALSPPGLKEIKRMELWSKWRKFVPMEERKDFWFTEEPDSELTKRVAAARALAKKTRANARATEVSAAACTGTAAMDQAPTDPQRAVL